MTCAGIVERLAGTKQGGGHDEPGVVQFLVEHGDERGLLVVDQGLVQSAGGTVAQDVGKHADGGAVGVGGGGNMVDGHQDRRVPHASQHHQALSVLRGLHGVRRIENSLGPRDPAKRFGDPPQRLLLVEVARHGEDGVIRLIILLIKRSQPLDRNALDIGAVSNGRLAVIMESVGGFLHPLHQNADGIVFARLELVAHHGHLGIEKLLFHAHVDHALGFEAQCPAQVGIAGGDGLEVVGAVEGGGAVPVGAVIGKVLLDVASVLGAEEEHVLDQVRHAGLAVAFVAGSD